MNGKMKKEIKTHTAEETMHAGFKIGKILKEGDVVCLIGDLGTGKTALTNGIASALGIEEYITSPTFTIVNEYRAARIPLFHFDVYRLADVEELFEIGFEEYMDGSGIVVIEWADQIKEILPDTCMWIDIRKQLDCSMDTRLITIEWTEERLHLLTDV